MAFITIINYDNISTVLGMPYIYINIYINIYIYTYLYTIYTSIQSLSTGNCC